MNYANPELIERLSAEYVLGTLRGKARDRFEQLMAESYRIRLSVWSWEKSLNTIASVSSPVQPPEHIWHYINKKIEPAIEVPSPEKTSPKETSPEETRVFNLWHWWSFAATAAAVLLAIGLFFTLPSGPTPSVNSIALFAEANEQPQWLVTLDKDSGRLRAKALNPVAVATGRAFELWLLPANGNPRSLGLLPVMQADESVFETILSTALLELWSNASALAVSDEPAGGSPTGLPTGDVIYQSPIIQL